MLEQAEQEISACHIVNVQETLHCHFVHWNSHGERVGLQQYCVFMIASLAWLLH